MTDDSSGIRRMMVRRDLEGAGVRDRRVLRAMEEVPRERFVPPGTPLRTAYGDHPLPIGHRQTISQPFIVAFMLEMLEASPGEKVLELGTGSGYQTALLAAMELEVVTLEVVPELAELARSRVEELYPDAPVTFVVADGWRGWAPEAPYDGIIVSAAPATVPPALTEQLSPDGGRLVLPLGGFGQRLVRLTRNGDDIRTERSLPVRFVPLVGGEGD